MAKTTWTFAEKHAKCFDGAGCSGPGCGITDQHVNTCAPRRRTTPTKVERRLAARIKDFEDTMSNANLRPQHGQEMHKPGSHKR